MPLLKWIFPRLLTLLILISPLPGFIAFNALCDWIDGPSYPVETCIETHRGAVVCGDLVRY